MRENDIYPTVAMLTDFGLQDIYVGVMKGVVLGIAPQARVVDVTHDVPAHDVRAAGFQLACAAPYFPVGTVHLVVVDPGVGSDRRVLAVQTGRALYVAPDNGVLTSALEEDPPEIIVSIENPEYQLPSASATFHGRDILAPAAAYLAGGLPIQRLGPEIDSFVTLSIPEARQFGHGAVDGKILHIDHFGNCITNIPGTMVEGQDSLFVAVGIHRVPGLYPSYASVPSGESVAVIGSSGYLEVAVSEGSAARVLGARIGQDVHVSGE